MCTLLDTLKVLQYFRVNGIKYVLDIELQEFQSH